MILASRMHKNFPEKILQTLKQCDTIVTSREKQSRLNARLHPDCNMSR